MYRCGLGSQPRPSGLPPAPLGAVPAPCPCPPVPKKEEKQGPKKKKKRPKKKKKAKKNHPPILNLAKPFPRKPPGFSWQLAVAQPRPSSPRG